MKKTLFFGIVEGEESAILRARILECQWRKIYEAEKKNCDICSSRFVCATIKARKFEIDECRSECWQHVVYAESKDEAADLYYYHQGNDEIVIESCNSGGDGEIEIHEVKE